MFKTFKDNSTVGFFDDVVENTDVWYGAAKFVVNSYYDGIVLQVLDSSITDLYFSFYATMEHRDAGDSTSPIISWSPTGAGPFSRIGDYESQSFGFAGTNLQRSCSFELPGIGFYHIEPGQVTQGMTGNGWILSVGPTFDVPVY